MTNPAIDPAADPSRRDEILDTAAEVFAESGVRTSLKEIADACDILPGSLYHHFASRDAIVAELIERYDADIEQLAKTTAARVRRSGATPGPDDIVELADAIATCAVRHRAALFLTMYEDASGNPVRSASAPPGAIVNATRAMLAAAQAAGTLRADVDIDRLAQRLCQSMLDHGVGMFRASRTFDQMPAIQARLLLDGLAVKPPKDSALDRSPAFKAAQRVMTTWEHEREDTDDRGAVLRAAARREFGRRGYEATTIRDIAAAAGVSTGSVYRLVGSKEELLVSVMQSFTATSLAGWTAVLDADATSIEKLDALMWVNANLIDQFSEEFRIQLGWVLESPPAADLGWSFKTNLRAVKALLQEGARSREIQLGKGSIDVYAQCVLELIWIPETLVQEGTRPALALARDTVLRGATKRG
jgi:AcrR family transcriptional regulator